MQKEEGYYKDWEECEKEILENECEDAPGWVLEWKQMKWKMSETQELLECGMMVEGQEKEERTEKDKRMAVVERSC